MFRVCAWCGLDLGLVPPHEDRAVTHGICVRCVLRVRTGREPPPTPLPPGHVLLVVARRAQPLYWHLSRAFEDLAGIVVIPDRRLGDRRRRAIKVVGNRRSAERRRPTVMNDPLPATFGLWIVRFRS